MNLEKPQLLAIGGSIVLLALLLSLRTKPRDLISLEKERSMNRQSTDPAILKRDAIKDISSNALSRVQILEAQLSEATDTSVRIGLLKDLSSTWYGEGQYAIAGSNAEQIATLMQSGQAWGIAGTTYAAGIKKSKQEKERKYCLSKALECLENAASQSPEEISYQLNRGIILAENPPQNNPMKGVLLLLDLNKNNPKNVPVINNIAKFALQTGQLDKVEQRLSLAIELEPNNRMSNCLMAQLYDAKGQKDKADQFRAKCDN